MKTIVSIILLVGGATFCWAQSNGGTLIERSREGTWRYSRQPETNYQANGLLIQHQLIQLGKQLNRLSVANPLVYSEVQGELHHYLQRLEEQNPNYGDPGFYQAVLLRFMQFEEQIKSAIVGRDKRPTDELWDRSVADSLHMSSVLNKTLRLLPYAVLFRRADYRSHLVHIVTAGETVKLLKTGRVYQYVQCGQFKGYIGTGMITGWIPN